MREAVGDEISLAVDANQAWTVKQAIGRIHALERFGLDCVEQPVAARDLTGMAEVARAVDTPLMADESLYSLEDAMTLVRLGAVGYLRSFMVLPTSSRVTPSSPVVSTKKAFFAPQL